MSESSFSTEFRALLSKHGITHPRFAHGAEPFNPEKPRVLYSGPVFDQEELVAATVALCQGKWAVNGEYVHKFEREFSKVVNQAETVAVNSGSSADLLMVAAAKKRFGWKDGDGVIVSPVGFPTTISAITLNGLTPVFVDIEWETLNADNDQIEARLQLPSYASRIGICGDFDERHEGHDVLVRCWHQADQAKWTRYGPTIRAILVSPVLGNPPDIDRLIALAERYGVKLLLDGCDSLGTTWRGKPLSTYFAASTCSFFPSHHISTLQGGTISSDDAELVSIARSMASWGKSCTCIGAGNLLPNGVCGKRFSCWLPEAPDVVVDHRYTYENGAAYNLQPLDIQGAIGLAQLKKLDHIHWSRRVARERIWEAFAPISTVMLPVSRAVYTAKSHIEAVVSWFGVPIICNDYAYKTRLVAHLESFGVQTRSYFAGNCLLHEGYKHLGRAADFPSANQVLERVFFIGCAPFYTEEHFAHIEKALREFSK